MAPDTLEMAAESPERVSCVSGRKRKRDQQRLVVMPDTERLSTAAIVARLAAEFPGVKAKGFRAAVRATCPGDAEVAEALAGFLPDAHCVLPGTREIHAIEVVDTSPIDFNKGQLYYELGDLLQDRGWSLSVVVFNYTGGLTCHLPFCYFGRVYTERFAGRELRDCVPAAMAAAKEGGWYDRK